MGTTLDGTSPKDADLSQVARHLGGTKVLYRLSAAALDSVARLARPVGLRAGQTLWRAGDPGDCVYVLVEGEVEILSRAADGLDVRIAALGRGAMVGEMAALEGGARSFDVVASRRCRLYRIPRQVILDVLRSDPDAALELIIELSQRLRASNDSLQADARLSLAGRLARLLSQSCNGGGVVTLTQTEMARRVRGTRETVNRCLRQWAAQEIIQKNALGVRILSPAGLQTMMDNARRPQAGDSERRSPVIIEAMTRGGDAHGLVSAGEGPLAAALQMTATNAAPVPAPAA